MTSEILNVIFLALCQFLFYDNQRLVEFICMGKIFWLRYPIFVIQFLASDICQYTSYGNLYFFNLIEKEYAQFLVKAVKRQYLFESCSIFYFGFL